MTDRERQVGFGTDMRNTGLFSSSSKKDEECIEKRIYYKIISGKEPSPICILETG